VKDARWVAQAAGAELRGQADAGPRRAVIDSREAGPGDLFVGLRGQSADGGAFAAQALEQGAWGALVGPEHAEQQGLTLAASDPLVALQALAREWRRDLGARVIGITGSTGKTSTKDILAALLAPHLTTHANRQNLNTEIGLPLSILDAPEGTEVLVLEMAMRGEDQIAELTAIAEPDVGVIVNVGPVHLELLGTVERVAAAKAELVRDMAPGASCVLPAEEPLLDAHRRDDLDTWTFGPGGEVSLVSFDGGTATVEARGEVFELEPAFEEPHNLLNLLAGVAAARAIGVSPGGRVEPAFSAMRGEIVELASGVTVVNDCYNANPMSMRAALSHLAQSPAQRRLAVLGQMAELGPEAADYHREIGRHASAEGVDVLVTVGREALPYAEGFEGEAHSVGEPEEAAGLLDELARPGDRVLIKGSRSVGLERVLAA
jgi:UDP-N-acetylmuramoyl-tripeptide--D-alanyl-D-alanine ligase